MGYKKAPDEQFLLLINLKCGHNCPDCLYEGILGKGQMSVKMIEKEIAPHVTRFHHISIAGGEPTEHPSFWKIIELLAKRKPTYLQVITNGVSFSGNLKQARAFAARLGKIGKVTGTPMVLRVSVDDFHAAKLRGKVPELKARVKRIRAAVENNPDLDLAFCTGGRKAQTHASLVRKYGLPADRTVFVEWQRGKQKQGGTVPRVIITPKGKIYATEQHMLSKMPPMGALGKERLPKILARRYRG